MSIREVSAGVKAFNQTADIKGGGHDSNGNAKIHLDNSKKLFAGIAETKEERKTKDYKDAGEAVAEIINESNPNVIAFGEQHCLTNYLAKKYKVGCKTTPQFFAEQIIPALAQKGIKDIVVEFLPSRGQTREDNLIYQYLQEEIDNLSPENEEDKKFSAKNFAANHLALFAMLSSTYDPQGALEFILAAKANGMKIHGGGLTFTQSGKLWECVDRKEMPKYVKIVNDNLYNTIKEILKENKKIAVYSGALHNDIKGEDPDGIFGDDLEKEGVRYKAVDLIVPEIVKNKTITYRDKMYARRAPEQGILRITEDKDGEVVVFAEQKRSTADIKFSKIFNSKEARETTTKFVNEFVKKFNIDVKINSFGNKFCANGEDYCKEKNEFKFYLYNVCGVDDKEIEKFIKEFEANNKGFKIYLDWIRVKTQKNGVDQKDCCVRINFDHELQDDCLPHETGKSEDNGLFKMLERPNSITPKSMNGEIEERVFKEWLRIIVE